MTNLEYVNLFISKVSILNKNTNAVRNIDFSQYKVSDIEDILEIFPQDVLYAENGVLKYIVNEYIKKVNDAFDKHEWWKCNTIHEKEGANNSESFF